MKNSRKFDLQPERAPRALVMRLQNGFRTLRQNRKLSIAAVVYWLLVARAVLFSHPENPLTRIFWVVLQTILMLAAAALFWWRLVRLAAR